MMWTNSGGKYVQMTEQEALATVTKEDISWGHVVPLALLVILVWVCLLAGPKRVNEWMGI